MRDYSIYDLRNLRDSYRLVVEATARPNAYKNLTPEQAEMLAQLSPSYSSNQIWGNTSNWICSMANRMIKYKNASFEEAYNRAKSLANDIADFEKFSKKLKKDISTVQSFEELETLMQNARNSGITMEGLSRAVMSDGRARQCYSFMKNGGDNFVITYEDQNYLIGYPTNFEYNSKFSAIGKWCHTGSFGNGEKYWSDYAHYPVFYILNKRTGQVLCASYQGNYGEVRDQKDNYPEGFSGSNWNRFFIGLGLKKPMVDDIQDTVGSYVEPDDLEPPSVYDRIDGQFVEEYLFHGLDSEMSEDDYGGPGGNFDFEYPVWKLSPDEIGSDETLYTHYAENVDAKTTYTFEEFQDMMEIVYSNSYSTNYKYSLRKVAEILLKNNYMRYLWNNATSIPHGRGGFITITDDKTMSERFKIEYLYNILEGENAPLGIDSAKKTNDIRKQFVNLIENFKKMFSKNLSNVFTNEYGYITFGTNDRDSYMHGKGPYISVSIDADEANHLAEQIQNGELYGGRTDIDILSLNLNGNTSFSVKRVDENDEVFVSNIRTFVSYVMYICKMPIDLDGQISFSFDDNGDANFYVDGNYDKDYRISPDSETSYERWRKKNGYA